MLPKEFGLFFVFLGIQLVNGDYSSFNILLLKPATVGNLGYKIEQGLIQAAADLNGKISVSTEHEAFIHFDTLVKCSQQTTHSLSAIDSITGGSRRVNALAGIPLKGYNFAILIEINAAACTENKKLLASAKPCGVSMEHRPLLGSLNVCTGERWNSFKAAKDLFRHEILHSLGFGTVLPKTALHKSPKEEDYVWSENRSKQMATRRYMDFAHETLTIARSHFDCPHMRGIETDGKDKIHLNEYIFGNELMTPKLSNTKNLFTLISATILENSYVGPKKWYLVNRTAIMEEHSVYWYGKKWGCDFVLKSCHEYYSSSKIGFPFCGQRDNHVKYCVNMNGNTRTFTSKCSLARFYPQMKADNGIRATPLVNMQHFTGSSPLYRFCRMNMDFLEDRINLAQGATIKNC